MTTRIRDQQILAYAMGQVWATDEATRSLIVSILARHASGIRLSRDDLAEIRQAGRARPAPQGGGQIGVVPLWGVLVPHAGVMVDISTEGTGLDQWREMFRAAVADPNVETVVLHVNSPGGSAEGVQETAKIVRDARVSKRIVAVADGTAASAAFYIASQADEFIATPSGQVGAVHTYMIHEDISAALEAEGVKLTLIGEPNSGAAEAPSFLPLSEENLAHSQRFVKQFYDKFVSDVAKGRGVDESTVVNDYGKGRVLTAQDALRAGMIDGVMSFDDALARLMNGKPLTGARQETQVAVGAAVPALPVFAQVGSGNGMNGLISMPGLTVTSAESPGKEAAHSDATPQSISQTAAAVGRTYEGGNAMETVSIDGGPATLEELAAQQTHLAAEMDDLVAQAAGRAFNVEEQGRFDTLEAEHIAIGNALTNINDREARRAKLAKETARRISGDGAGPGFATNADRKGPSDIFDLSAYRSHASTVEDLAPLWRDAAKRANETTPYRTRHQDETRAFVEALLEQDGSNRPHDSFAHRILVTANPAYDAAFGRWVMGRDSNADLNVIKMAVTNTGLGSETPVPVTIDPTVLYTGDGARSPLRALAQVVTITGLTWRGIGSDGVSLAYGAETAAITPVDPTFVAPDVSVIPARGEIQFSVDVEGDWPTLRSELQRMFSSAKFRVEADKFLHGTGSGEPTGLVYALYTDATSVIETAAAHTLALDDVIGLSDELPSSFDYQATWLAHKAFYSNVAALAAAEGRIDVWVPLSGGFNQQSGLTGYSLLNSPAATASEMSKLFTTGGEDVAVIGDFGQGFVIVDRVGLNVELDLHPRDSNGKWTGNRGLICWFRNNTALRTPNAFRMLQIKHT